MIRVCTMRRAVLVVVVGLWLSGCAVTDPSRYYSLTTSRAPAPGPTGMAPNVTVGVGPVTIPGYLERPQLVTRDGSDAIHIWPYHRWAEPLDVGIAEALADDLGARIPSDRIALFPWRGPMGQAVDYQVVVAVARLDGTPGRSVILDARWALLGKGNKGLAFKRSTLTEPVVEDGFPALVAAMNRAISSLGQEIGQEIQAQSVSRSATRD